MVPDSKMNDLHSEFTVNYNDKMSFNWWIDYFMPVCLHSIYSSFLFVNELRMKQIFSFQ